MRVKIWIVDPEDNEGWYAEEGDIINPDTIKDRNNRDCKLVKLADGSKLLTPLFRIELLCNLCNGYGKINDTDICLPCKGTGTSSILDSSTNT